SIVPTWHGPIGSFLGFIDSLVPTESVRPSDTTVVCPWNEYGYPSAPDRSCDGTIGEHSRGLLGSCERYEPGKMFFRRCQRSVKSSRRSDQSKLLLLPLDRPRRGSGSSIFVLPPQTRGGSAGGSAVASFTGIRGRLFRGAAWRLCRGAPPLLPCSTPHAADPWITPPRR